MVLPFVRHQDGESPLAVVQWLLQIPPSQHLGPAVDAHVEGRWHGPFHVSVSAQVRQSHI